MAKKCPKGQLCIESGLIITIIVLVAIAGFFLYRQTTSETNTTNLNNIKTEELEKEIDKIKNKNNEPLYVVNKSYERAANPFMAPLRSDPNQPVIAIHSDGGGGISINNSTRGYSADYQQIGILTGGDQILPLFGKTTWNGSNKWLYYTSTDKFHMIKLPVEVNNKNCTQEHGCNEIYDGDMINVPAYSKEYKASIYQLDSPRYIPYV